VRGRCEGDRLAGKIKFGGKEFVAGGWRPRKPGKPDKTKEPDGKERKRKLLSLESLILAACLVFVALIGSLVFEYLTAGLAVQDAAVKFAATLRQAQEMARSRDRPIRIVIVPGTLSHPFGWVIQEGKLTLKGDRFPDGVAVAGGALLDLHGIPREKTEFKFTKHGRRAVVQVSEKGIVGMP